jgi:hypothetical protein
MPGLASQKLSILAASRNNGSVYLTKISLDTTQESGDYQLKLNATHEASPRQRVSVSKLAWRMRNDDLVLAIARSGSLTVSIHSTKNIDNLTSKIVRHRHNNFSPVVGKHSHYQD